MKTRDVRTLDEYINHFKKYNRVVYFDPNLKGDEFGIIETENERVYFIPILYQTRKIYSVGTYMV